MSLSRRVQLAVIAHIRHTHTRYDLLLRETSWENARKAVEGLCLDILVKWRGDEETGRDQLDEVLREIVVIDDSDSEEEEDENDSGSEEEASSGDATDVSEEPAILGIPPSQQKLLSRPASTQVSTAQNDTIPKIVHLSNASTQKSIVTNSLVPTSQNPDIGSRTRSKPNPNRTNRQAIRRQKRTHTRNKRLQAWKDALSRQAERLPGPRTPLEQTRRVDSQPIYESPHMIPSNTFAGPSTPSLYTAPHNPEYQAIYAVDDRPRLRRPTKVSQASAAEVGTNIDLLAILIETASIFPTAHPWWATSTIQRTG